MRAPFNLTGLSSLQSSYLFKPRPSIVLLFDIDLHLTVFPTFELTPPNLVRTFAFNFRSTFEDFGMFRSSILQSPATAANQT